MSRSRSRSPSPTEIKEGKKEVPEQMITDILSPNMIEQIAFLLEKQGSLGPWLNVSRDTMKHSKPAGSFQQFLDLPYEIQNLIFQELGFEDISNLFSTSRYVARNIRRNKGISKIPYFDENKEYQRSKYKKFYDLVRRGWIKTKPNLKGTTLSNKEISERIIECNCKYNQLTSLPPLPNCKNLVCDYNQLTSLPPLPNCTDLVCLNNQLTSLPPLPNCKILYCSNNELTSLSDLTNCIILNCSYNKLTSLPPLPNCIELWCIENLLTSLPPLPNCKILYCSNNELTSLPILPKEAKIYSDLYKNI